jgi:hypothetical protein
VALTVVVHCVLPGTLWFGCATHTNSKPSAARASVAGPVHAVHGNRPETTAPFSSAVAQPSPLLAPSAQLTEIPRWYRSLDRLSTYRFQSQTVPAGYRPLPEQSHSRAFPGAKFSEIWGYEIGTNYLPDCTMLASDGTLCPNVIFPGKALDADQVKLMMSIAQHPVNVIDVSTSFDSSGRAVRHARSRGRTRCGDDPTAMFVFYDASHKPVGVVGVDRDCSEWSLWPAPKDAWVGFALTEDNEQRILNQLCVGLDLWTCSAGTEQRTRGGASWPKTDAERTAAKRALLPLLLREWPSVDESKSLASTSRSEREQLCAWYDRSAAIAASLFNRVGGWLFNGLSLEDEQGHALRLQPFDECIDSFPACSGTVGTARACIERHLEHFWNRDEACHLDCVWGIRPLGIPSEP